MDTQKIEIVSYDPAWPTLFQQEAERLTKALEGHAAAIHHIGSTSIPNMAAKPVIDILIELKNLDVINVVASELNTLGYEKLRRQVIPNRSFFSLLDKNNARHFHLHIYEVGDPQVIRHVNFRDYMINHPDEAATYENLKKNLAQQFKYERLQYVLGKDKLVQHIDAKAKLWSAAQKNRKFLPQNPGLPARLWTQEKIIHAMEANLNVHMTYYAQYLDQVEFIRSPEFILVNSKLNDDTFNYVLDVHLDKTIPEKIQAIKLKFLQEQQPFSWWISPGDQPANLAEYLQHANFENSENNIAMYLNLDNWVAHHPIPTHLKIVRATDEKTLRDFALILANDKTAFEKYFSWIASVMTEEDPVEFYVGYVHDKPVTRGYVIYYAGVAGLHMLSTVEDERNKGYGTAMQQYRLQRAKQLGYHIAVLQASAEGLPLYKKLGYKECGMYKEFKPVS